MRHYFTTRKKSFQYAFSGVQFVLRTQKNAWIHLLFTAAVILAGVLLGLTWIEWVFIILCIAFVWVTEFVNTAIEAAVDLSGDVEHPVAKISKDVAAAAVLIAAISAVAIGALIFIPKLLDLLKNGQN